MLLAPQIILNSFPTVQSNKSISEVMAEVDLWAIHGLYLIVIANPRFKASLRLTEPRAGSAVTKSGGYHCPGIHAIRMSLNTDMYVCIYYIPRYMCVCILCQRQNLTKVGRDEEKGIHGELSLKIYWSQCGWWKRIPRHTFPNSPHLYSRPRWFFDSHLFRIANLF